MTPTHTGTDMDYWPTGYSGQTNPQPKLKPCPFCGADPINLSIENDEYGGYYIYCNVCDAYYENANAGLDNLINGWNRRAHDPIEELRKSAPIHLTYEQMKRYYYGHVRPFDINTEEKE